MALSGRTVRPRGNMRDCSETAVVLYPSRQNGKKTSSDIAERVQIVLKGNELLEPEHKGASLPATR